MPSIPPRMPAGIHGSFAQQRLPDWLKHAQSEDLQRLRNAWQAEQGAGALWFDQASVQARMALLDYQAGRRRAAYALARLLKPLQGITGFCEPLLVQAMGEHIDVNTAEFVQIHRESVLLGSLLSLRPRRQSLLQAALQNFAGDARFAAGSALAPQDSFGLELVAGSERGAPRFRYRYQATLDMQPQHFARLCHTLDLGARYQQHLREVFDAPATRETIRALAIEWRCQQLRVAAQVALMKGEISQAAHLMLLRLAQGEHRPLFNSQPVRISEMRLYGCRLADVLLFSVDGSRSQSVEPVLVYLPGAPLYPLKQYPSAQAAHADLLVNLRNPAYQRLLRQRLPQAEQARVMALVNAELYHQASDRDGLHVQAPRPRAQLNLEAVVITSELFGYQQDAHVEKLKEDARVLAVPSADADEEAREARLAAWESLGLNLLNVAAFVVPGLGEVMAAVTAVQLVEEVIEASDAWSEGERSLAWAHLESLGMNLALLAGLGSAGSAVPLAEVEALDGLVKVSLPGGEQRLWRPALEGYHSEVALEGEVADAHGFYLYQGRRYVRMEGRFYAVYEHDGQWRIRVEGDAYAPELVHNGQGAWRLKAQDPLHWQGAALWRRLGHLTDGLDDEALMQLAGSTGTDEDGLRRVLADNSPLPPLLEEGLVRRQAARQVAHLGQRLRTQGEVDDVALLKVLQDLPGWPAALKGRLTAGADLPQALALLDEVQQKGLLGPYLADGIEGRVGQLRQVLADHIEAHPQVMFDALLATGPALDTPGQAVLQRDFPGLTPRLARALAGRANGEELAVLLGEPGRVPLRLAEEARWLLEDLRLNRACEALYLGYPQDTDACRLALASLERLPGWPARLRIEVREGGLGGLLVDSIGPVQGGEVKYLIRRGQRYQPIDAQGGELGGVQSLFDALLRVLPNYARSAMDLHIGQPDTLRLRLAADAVQDRGAARQALGVRPRHPWYKPPLQLGDGRTGYPLSGRGPRGVGRSPGLIDRVRALYPTFDLPAVNAWLDSTGVAEDGLPALLENKARELDALQRDLQQWIGEFQGQATGAHSARIYAPQTRVQVAQAIERAWRRQSERVHSGNGQFVGYRLDLTGQSLLRLPQLTADFSHVAALHLDRMGLQDLPAAFCRGFTRLRWLSLNDNALARLPSVLDSMPGLTKLHLANNALVLDAEACTRLAGMTALKVLQLDRNPLGQFPDFSSLFNLHGLSLRGTGLATWPVGLEGLPHLQALDLRANQISRIPSHVLADDQPVRQIYLNRQTYLHGNPLDAQTLQQLEAYTASTGITLGVGARRGPHAAHGNTPAEVSASWLVGESAARVEQAQALWMGLRAEPDSEAFFQLLADLRRSADFQRSYGVVKQRVWALLEAMREDGVLREQLFSEAAHPATCADGEVLVFSQLEVRLLVRQALAGAAQSSMEWKLLELARGLYRLDRVEAIALRDIAARRALGQRVDDVEVRLAYRVRLAEDLDLPGQPRHMLFERTADVSAGQLAAARQEVLASEDGPALKASFVERDFWVEYLRQRYAERFESVNKPYYARLEAVETDKLGMSDAQYKQQVETIDARRKVEEQRLLETLTSTIWNALPDQLTEL